MNIFVLDKNPVLAAEYACDKHVVKQITESSQLLCTALAIRTGHIPEFGFKPTHTNHPCAKWCRETNGNFQWLVKHTKALIKEYDKRYGKTSNFSRSRAIVQYCEITSIDNNDSLTPFVLAMPEQYKSSNPVVSYRNYYRNEKSRFASWKSTVPYWWKV